MRMLVTVQSLADAAYDVTYHHNLRGRIWRAIKGSRFEQYHDDSDAPVFSFSNIYPWGELSEGDERQVLIASPFEGLPQLVASDVDENPEFNVGEMPFEATDSTVLSTDVGEPGTTGTLETATGVFIPLEQDDWNEYGIDVPYNADRISWTPEHSLSVFRQKLRQSAEHKFHQVHPDYRPFIDDDCRLFKDFEMIKTYSLEVPVSQTHLRTLILSKWKFNYRVQSDVHRRVLNTLLDTGVGWRNRLGFGFLNKRVSET